LNYLAYSQNSGWNAASGTILGGDRRHYPWLYSTAGIRDAANAQVIGAVYVAMPPDAKAICPAGEGISDGDGARRCHCRHCRRTAGVSYLNQSVATPAQQQTQAAGDYTAPDKMNWLQLGRLLDQMATKRTQTRAASFETAVNL